ncbi:MAG: SdpI family protein [Sandaracinaceae bacterium]|nr:SdpI family protein [Sandaracinaceae bacterium]
MRGWRLFTVCAVLTVLGLLLSLGAWSHVPEPMPIHFDLYGRPDGWAPRAFGLLFAPLLGAGLAALLGLLTGRDPATRAVAPHLAIGGSLFGLGLHALVVQAALGSEGGLSMGGLSLLLGALCLGLGWILPKVGPNRWVGIRFPWTMKDEVVWELTHRFAGRAFLAGGVLTILAGLLLPAPWVFGALMLSFFGAAIVPSVYSYVLYRIRKKSG